MLADLLDLEDLVQKSPAAAAVAVAEKKAALLEIGMGLYVSVMYAFAKSNCMCM